MRMNLSVNNSESRSAGSINYHAIRPGTGFNKPRQADMDSLIPDTGRGKKRQKCKLGAPRLGCFHQLRAAGLIQAHVSDVSLLCGTSPKAVSFVKRHLLALVHVHVGVAEEALGYSIHVPRLLQGQHSQWQVQVFGNFRAQCYRGNVEAVFIT